MKKAIRIALLIISVVMIGIGVNRGENLVVLNKAVRV
ncbi:CD1871A family CXXC motif-containing protein [Clostridium tepidiprofundi]|nr:CD1871A family CXXC motif-containing protein [Clostridium tepidiprofundi]